MKTFLKVLGGFAIIGLPLFVILIVLWVSNINIFDNSDFWYDYMAYCGTVGLAMVSIYQTEKSYKISDRMLEIEEQRILPYIDINREKSKVTEINENTLKIKLWLTNYSEFPIHNIYLSKTKLDIRKIHKLYNCDGIDSIIHSQLSTLPEWQGNGKEKENENYILTTIAGLREIPVEHFQKGKLVETEHFPNSESLFFNEEIKNTNKPIVLFLYMQNIRHDVFEQETKIHIVKRRDGKFILTMHSKKISLVEKSEEKNNG